MRSPASTPVDCAPVDCALKEWAILCRALARGQQSVLLRKGGLHDPRQRAGARATHDPGSPTAQTASTFALRPRFALLPTYFHLDAPDRVRELRASLRPALHPTGLAAPPAETLAAIATLTAAWWIDQLDPLLRLADAGALPLSHEGVERRFAPNPRTRRRELRHPGAWLLLLRVQRLSRALALSTHARPEAARGCRSWVEFETPLTPTGAQLAIPDAIHEQRAHGLLALLGPPTVS